MRSITMFAATVLLTGSLVGVAGTPLALADESPVSSTPSTGTGGEAGTATTVQEPTPATTEPEGSGPPSEAGEVQERGVFGNALEPKIFMNPQATTPVPATKIPLPGITAPKPGTVLPPDRYQAPTPNLTLIANGLRLNHKSLTTLVTLPPNLPVSKPVEIGIIYSSPAGIGQAKQSYAGGTGNQFLYHDREGDGKPRAMEIAITLTEPSAGEVGIYRMKWQANLDPLYDVAMGRFEFTLLNFCDSAGQTEVRFLWSLPDSRSISQKSWSTAIVPDTTHIPEFRWVGLEIGWSQPLHEEVFRFVDDDPGWVDVLTSLEETVFGFGQRLSPADLLNTPTGARWVTGVIKAENDSCKAKFKYWRAKNLLRYPTLQPH
ncbi:MAG: hypothetical protein P0111_10495 [Nitrospira sp.]|nr:hypothetical protein [Nitrospira sp.]